MTTLSTQEIPTLTKKELAYCTLRAKGENKSRSYLLAGYKAKDGHQAGSMACKLEAKPRIEQYLSTLKTSVAVHNVLTVEAKRRFLHDLVHADPSDPSLPGHLVQEVREEVDQEGRRKKVIKLPSKLEAINIDNKMAGDNYADRHDTGPVNQFQFLIALGRAGAGQGAVIDAVTEPAR